MPGIAPPSALFVVAVCMVLLSAAACIFVPGPGQIAPPMVSPAPGQPFASALTAQWVSYGRKATCADWAGADGMQGIRLDRSTIAWFFSDTYLGTIRESAPAFRGSLISNSLVIQRTGKRTTVTGGGACPWDRLPASEPRPVVEPGPRQRGWYWGGDGMVVGDRVVKFFHHFRWGQARYVPSGIATISIPVRRLTAEKPSRTLRLRPHELPAVTPVPGGTPIMWGAALLPVGDMVYVYGWQAPDVRVQQKRLYLARVPRNRLDDVTAWTFYAGAGRWTTARSGAQPVQPNGAELEVASAFSVVSLGGQFWLIQLGPALDGADVVAIPAPTPWGPFDPRRRMVLYRVPGVGADAAHDYKAVYDARVITPLSTKETLVVAYHVNTNAVTPGCRSLNFYTDVFYRPRFITVPTAEFARRTAQAQGVGAGGEPPHTPIVRTNPTQWFDTWNYPNGCPPVPAISRVTVRPSEPGTLELSWPSAGLDVAYRVYRRTAGHGRFVLARTVNTTGVTLDGLTGGKSYEWRVQPVNAKGYTGPVSTGVARVP